MDIFRPIQLVADQPTSQWFRIAPHSYWGDTITLIYNLVGITVAILGGMLIQRLKAEKYVKPELLKFRSRQQVEAENGGAKLPVKELLTYFWHDGMAITKSIFPYVVLGVGIGALIHGFVPAAFVEQHLALKSWWTVPRRPCWEHHSMPIPSASSRSWRRWSARGCHWEQH